MKTKLKSILAVALCAVGLSAWAKTYTFTLNWPGVKTVYRIAGSSKLHDADWCRQQWSAGFQSVLLDKDTAKKVFGGETWAEIYPNAESNFVEEGVKFTGSDGSFSYETTLDNDQTWVLFALTEATEISPGAAYVVYFGTADAEGGPITLDTQLDSGTLASDTPPKQEVSAVSAEGWLDLTVGDRVVTADEEPIVVDPAWGEATTAKVQIDGEASARSYTELSIDTWDTTTLPLGRYGMTLTAGKIEGEAAYTAGFWKIDTTSWEVFDSSNITADKTFEEGKTYLVLGTNTVSDGVKLTVTDGAKFAYGEGAAGFKGGTVAMPKRYEQKTDGDLYQIVEKIKGCEDNPWEVGEGVEAYTNGTELVIVGEGTVEDVSEVLSGAKGGIEAITIPEATVKGAEENAFNDFNNISLTLPDGWQGELPKNGVWYGATGVELTRWPMAVKNVKPQQRYPWNGLVDVTYDVSGEGKVTVTVSATANGAKVNVSTVTGTTTADLGDGNELKKLKLTWDAKADFGDEGLHEKIKVKLSITPAEPD